MKHIKRTVIFKDQIQNESYSLSSLYRARKAEYSFFKDKWTIRHTQHKITEHMLNIIWILNLNGFYHD